MTPIETAVARCSQCGLCLADCPSYRATGLEPDSPRGRIQALSLGVAPEAMAEADYAAFWGCLSCGACLDTCPTGVDVVGAWRTARIRRPDSTIDRIVELEERRADLLREDPASAQTLKAVRQRAEQGPPPEWVPIPAATMLVASDLVPEHLTEQASELARGCAGDRIELAPPLFAGASGLLLDAGLGSLHETYTAAVRETCHRAAADLLFVAVDAEAWRLAPLISACGATMVTLAWLLARFRRNAPAGPPLLAGFELAVDAWRRPLEYLTGQPLTWPGVVHRAVSGPVVFEERALDVNRGLVEAFRTSVAARPLLTADVRALDRLESAVFYLDHVFLR